MADAKIEIKVGGFTFTGEGTEKWLSSELDKLLAKIPELVDISPAEPADGGDNDAPKPRKRGNLGTLATFLREKNATDNQIKKFLATAVRLHGTTGNNRLTTGDVKKALKDASQPKLTNASHALIKNVGKGHAEKDGKSFFVTDPGRTTFGL